MAQATATISNLFVWPIKGCAGIPVKAAVLSKTGLRFDREWAVVRADGKFLSMRECPKLTLVQPSFPEALVQQPSSQADAAAAMAVAAPGMQPLAVPLRQSAVQLKAVRVWEWSGNAADQGDAAAEWFSQYLGQPCRLVRYVGSQPASDAYPAGAVAGAATDMVRPTDPEFAEGYETSLSDGFPMLLASQDSLEDLNQRLAASGSPGASLVPLSITRFRPNIVVQGLPAWAEDQYRTLLVGDGSAGQQPVEMTSVKPCSRCKVPTIDPLTGVPSEGEPIDILSTFRSGAALAWKPKSWKYAVHFGWNLVHAPAAIGSVIRVGDAVTLTGPQVEW